MICGAMFGAARTVAVWWWKMLISLNAAREFTNDLA
jgi:hypothetical protein